MIDATDFTIPGTGVFRNKLGIIDPAALARAATESTALRLAELQATIVPFARNHLSIFYEAFQRYGKGRHPARLNMGDCFTYAIAKASGLPVLFVGDDFTQTDLTAA